jgi:pyruvate-formate lyase-activating enzyme
LTKELKAKLKVYNTLITNGYKLPNLCWVDEVCVGIKAKTRRLHREYTGKDPKPVFMNLESLNKNKIQLRTESIFIPGYIGLQETECIAKAISRINPNIPHRIDAYIPVPGMSWRRPMQKEMKEALIIARKYLNKVTYIKQMQKCPGRSKILLTRKKA